MDAVYFPPAPRPRTRGWRKRRTNIGLLFCIFGLPGLAGLLFTGTMAYEAWGKHALGTRGILVPCGPARDGRLRDPSGSSAECALRERVAFSPALATEIVVEDERPEEEPVGGNDAERQGRVPEATLHPPCETRRRCAVSRDATISRVTRRRTQGPRAEPARRLSPSFRSPQDVPLGNERVTQGNVFAGAENALRLALRRNNLRRRQWHGACAIQSSWGRVDQFPDDSRRRREHKEAVAELVDAPSSQGGAPQGAWGFESPRPHIAALQGTPLMT